MINTYNESSLHKTLKVLYAAKYNGKTEVPFKNFIADIITEKGKIIEIQTASPSALKAKVKVALDNKTDIMIVHPVASEKIIETYDENKKLVSKRKSPKRCNIYTELDGLTGLAPFLRNRHLSLVFLEVKICEQRIKTSEPVQLKNKSRHFRKAWYKTGKKLLEIKDETIFCGKKDYLSLIPESVRDTTPRGTEAARTSGGSRDVEFSSKDLRQNLSKENAPYANLVLWILSKSGIIECIRTEGRLKIYKVNGK
ncbi:hypothetical protein [Treponema sp.]|uniref:hypothetical protein n=1 Tax=Treponema sp. TaxID=166 RepID=UPI00298DB500|nr:hypothetical protein [Treponema sp.]MCR5613173.1 hypothetical protein [Treponema sp.]